MLNSIRSLKDYTIMCTDEELGKVKELYFNDQNWDISYIVVYTGNWLIDRQVLVSPLAVASINRDKRIININISKKQVENSPLLASEKPVSEQFINDFNTYYSYPTYGGMYPLGNVPHLKPKKSENDIMKEKKWDQSLRSSHEVSRYNVKHSNESIGFLDDFLVDLDAWKIHYLIVKTHSLYKGKNALVATSWINYISYPETAVYINLSGDEIEKSPHYSDEELVYVNPDFGI